MSTWDLPPPIFTMNNGRRCRTEKDACDPMDELVAKLVARYESKIKEDVEGTQVKPVSELSDEELGVDLMEELTKMFSGRNEPMPMKVAMLVVLKAIRILRGQE